MIRRPPRSKRTDTRLPYTKLVRSEGNWLKLTERSPLPFVASRPLKVAFDRQGPSPRSAISDASPFSRCVVAPLIVWIAGPTDSAGRSPLSPDDGAAETELRRVGKDGVSTVCLWGEGEKTNTN